MSNALIKVEMLAGTDIAQAIQEASELAVKLEVAYVVFSFNGITVNVRQFADVGILVDKYDKVLINDDNFVI